MALYDSSFNEELATWEPDGDLLEGYYHFFEAGMHLAIMPVARVHMDYLPIVYAGAIVFYPAGSVDLAALNVIPFDKNTTSLAELQSSASQVDVDMLERHTLVVLPCSFNWNIVIRGSHTDHLEFIRTLSERIDYTCFNFIRYALCRLEPIDCLPGRAGQNNDNPMMAGVLLYNHELREGRIIGGAAFTHCITTGLGLPLTSISLSRFPTNGEVGRLVQHALSLYTSVLEANDATYRFIQALSLLEFFAYPGEYRQFKDVKRIVARYVTQDPNIYATLLERFNELTGKKDAAGTTIGYRTRIVHNGERLEQILPQRTDRRALFLELDKYIRCVLDHMIAHSELAYDDYKLKMPSAPEHVD